jgi:4a-hydroxytetrahydrobiopterin dehydratase
MFTKVDNKLIADFEFKDFQEAWAFMSQIALISEKINHHPYWSNVYNKVHIELSTHDAGNLVTQKDEDLALRINKVYEKYDNNK